MLELLHGFPNDLFSAYSHGIFATGGAKGSTQEKKKLRIFHGIFASGGLCPHKKKKTSDIRKLGNFKKIPEMFRFDGEYPASYPRSKF